MGWTPDYQTGSVITSLTIQSTLGLIVIVLFENLRYQKELFAPRLRNPGKRSQKSIISYSCDNH
jgi:hypothetical protein